MAPRQDRIKVIEHRKHLYNLSFNIYKAHKFQSLRDVLLYFAKNYESYKICRILGKVKTNRNNF